MENSSQIEIEILNWEKYNPRTDAKAHSWFRFEHSLIESPPFYKWPGDHIKVLIYVLSQASKKKSRFVRLDLDHPVSAIRVSEVDVRETLQKMIAAEVIKIVTGKLLASNYEVTSSQGVPTNERTNERNETKRTNEQKKAPRVSSKPLEAPRCIPEFSSLEDVIQDRGISEELQKSWLEAFPDSAWVIAQVRKAIAWEAANPAKRKKQFGRFVTNWMNKDWDGRRVASSGSTTQGSNWAEKRDAANNDALEQVLAARRAKESST